MDTLFGKKDIHGIRNFYKTVNRFLIPSLLVCTVCLASCRTITPISVDDRIIAGIHLIADHRDIVEHFVLRLKKLTNSYPKQYKRGEDLYITAQAKYNEWIDSFKFVLYQEQNPNSNETFKKNLNAAEQTSNNFITYVKSIEDFSTSSDAPAIGSITCGVIVGLGQAGTNVWRAIQDVEAAEQKRRIKSTKHFLDMQKWETIDEIK